MSSKSKKMSAAVFLDRDGTINEEMGYINHLDRFVLLPGAAAAIRRINECGLRAVVITNQSGAARGYFPLELIDRVHQKLHKLLEAEGAYLDKIYICVHAPPGKGEGRGCDCRKPETGLMLQAARELQIDLEKSYVVGDRLKDMQMARNAGARAILVLTGYGKGEKEFLATPELQPDFIATDLAEAVDWVLSDTASKATGHRSSPQG